MTANATPITSGVVAGDSGNISINATDLVQVEGTAPNLSIPSAISAATFSTGRAGNVTVNTSRLRVKNGGRVDSSTTAIGTAGSVTIDASDSIEVSGFAPESQSPSFITSAATVLEQDVRDTFRLFTQPSGTAGQVAVETTPPDRQGVIHISLAVAEESIQQRAVLYDKEGDAHFDTISAFIKSVRGSDPDAALYWLARMVYAGEDPRFILRRLSFWRARMWD